MPGPALDDDGNVLLRLEGDVRGILSASQIAIGRENDLQIRVHGTEGSLALAPGRPERARARAGRRPVAGCCAAATAYLSEAAQKATRIPPGHPEGYIEAFANVYLGVFEAIRARREGRELGPLEGDYPDGGGRSAGRALHRARRRLQPERRQVDRGLTARSDVSTDASYTPRPDDQFTFGLVDRRQPRPRPVRAPTRPPLDPVEAVEHLAELGAYGVKLHDDDLVPFGAWRPSATASWRVQGGAGAHRPGRADGDHEPVLPPGLQGRRVHRQRPRVRALALQKTMAAIDLGAELGAKVYVFWGGREGVEVDAAKDPRDALERFREALNFLCEYVLDQGYDLRFALEPKPNEPRGDLFLPTVGHVLHFIATLDHPEMVGVNPEVAHETMAGLSFRTPSPRRWGRASSSTSTSTGSGSALRPGLPLRPEDLKDAFFLVKLLEDARLRRARATSTPTPYRTRATTASGTSPRGACGRT